MNYTSYEGIAEVELQNVRAINNPSMDNNNVGVITNNAQMVASVSRLPRTQIVQLSDTRRQISRTADVGRWTNFSQLNGCHCKSELSKIDISLKQECEGLIFMRRHRDNVSFNRLETLPVFETSISVISFPETAEKTLKT